MELPTRKRRGERGPRKLQTQPTVTYQQSPPRGSPRHIPPRGWLLPRALHASAPPTSGVQVLEGGYRLYTGIMDANQIATSSGTSGDHRIIRNSRNQPLSVKFDETTWEGDPDQKAKRTAFSSLMEPSASRWQSLDYRRALASENDIWILSLPLHNIRQMEINAPIWRDQRHTLDASKLSYVKITRFSLNWRSLSGLQSLILNMTDPTLNELMTMLQASPDLRYLSLENTRLKLESENTPNSSKVILPQLHGLDICRASTQSICLLLDSIETSSLKTFSVTMQYKHESEDCSPLCESAGRYIGAFPLPPGKKQATFSIWVWDREFRFHLGGRKIHIRNYTWDNGNEKLAYLASTIKHLDNRVYEEVKTLELHCRDHSEEVGEYLRIVHLRFPQITRILLTKNDMVVACQQLGSPSQTGLGTEWLLPKLTKLELDLYSTMDTDLAKRIVQLIMKRKAAEGVKEITELRIICDPGLIDPDIVELFRQSVASVEHTKERDWSEDWFDLF